MDKHGFLIVGGGARGLYFTTILEQKLDAKVLAIVETHQPTWEFLTARLAEEKIAGVTLLESVDDLIERYPAASVEGVFLMTPEWTHFQIFEKLASAGYAIFLEKPVATKPEDARRILEIANHHPHPIQVGFVLRYSVFYEKVKEIVDSGRLGRLLSIQMNERLPLHHGAKFKRSWHSKTLYSGGFINEKCSHDLDLMMWIKAGQSRPVKLFSVAGKGFCLEKERYETEFCRDCKVVCPFRDEPSGWAKSRGGTVYHDATSVGVGRCIYANESDISDHQSVTLHFADGSHGVFSAISMSGEPGRDILIHGTDGFLMGNLEQGSLVFENYREGGRQKVALNQLDAHGGGDDAIVAQFLNCVRTGQPPRASVRDGCLASLVAFWADESAASGKVIDLTQGWV